MLCADYARFFNHSDDPNVRNTDDSSQNGWCVDRAARDITRGEELTCDYREFDADFDQKFEGH